MFGLFRDLYSPLDYRHGFVPALLLDDYDSQPHVRLNVIRPRRQTGQSSKVEPDNKKNANQFKVMLNVRHFRPDEIEVKTVDNCVVIHGKHEEQADQHGFVSREFTRRYQLPDDVEPQTVRSSLSKDGVLTITAPRKAVEPPPANERVVPITIQRPAAVEEAQKQEQQAAQQSSEEPKQ